MLTHSAGFLAMANKYRDFPFDKTLTDIVIKASQWKVKQPPKLALAILPILEEMMDGVVVFALKAKKYSKVETVQQSLARFR